MWETFSVVPSAREPTLCPRGSHPPGDAPVPSARMTRASPWRLCVCCGVTEAPDSAKQSTVAGPEVQSSCYRRACAPAGLSPEALPSPAGCACSPVAAGMQTPVCPPERSRRALLQVYHCRPLALAFLELTVVRRFHEHAHQPGVPPPLRAVLRRLSALYAVWSLGQHTALLYRGETALRRRAGRSLRAAY